MILKIVPKAGYECTMRAKESQNINLMRLSEQFLELVSISLKQAQTLYFLFSRTLQAKILKTISECTESTDLIV